MFARVMIRFSECGVGIYPVTFGRDYLYCSCASEASIYQNGTKKQNKTNRKEIAKTAQYVLFHCFHFLVLS